MKANSDKKGLSLDVPEYIKCLVPYPPGKPLEELEREFGISNAIKLASNENPFGSSPRAVEAITKWLPKLHRYPDGSGYYLKNKLASHHKTAPENLVLGNGSNEIIDLLIRILVRPGKEVITSHPSFLVYQKMVQASGGTNKVVELKDFTHDLAGIASAVTDNTSLIFLDNPNNPTGSILTKRAFDQFLEKLPNHLLVVLDEAYMEFAEGADTPTATEYLGKDDRIVGLRTFSKAYGIAGLRVGYGLMHKDVAALLDRIRQPFNVNVLAQAAAEASIDDQDHLLKTIRNNELGKAFLTEALEKIGFKVLRSFTNFVLVDTGMEANRLCKALLPKGVIIRHMGSYGLEQFVRITIGTPEENERCIEAIKEVLSQLEV